MRRYLKKILLTGSPLRRLGERGGPRIAILRYHSIRPDDDCRDSLVPAALTHSVTTFENHLKAIVGRYQTIDFDTIAGFLDGSVELQQNSIAVSFDDGFTDNLELAAPLLRKYRVPAVFFVTSGHVVNGGVPWFLRTLRAFRLTQVRSWRSPDQSAYSLDDDEQKNVARRRANRICAAADSETRDAFLSDIESSLQVPLADTTLRVIMDPDQLRSLSRMGFTVGSHSESHPNLALLDPKEAEQEIGSSRLALEEITGSPVRHFAYPNPIVQPHFTDTTIALTQAAGYLTGATSVSGTAETGTSPFALPRLSVPDNPDDLLWRIEAAFMRAAWTGTSS